MAGRGATLSPGETKGVRAGITMQQSDVHVVRMINTYTGMTKAARQCSFLTPDSTAVNRIQFRFKTNTKSRGVVEF